MNGNNVAYPRTILIVIGQERTFSYFPNKKISNITFYLYVNYTSMKLHEILLLICRRSKMTSLKKRAGEIGYKFSSVWKKLPNEAEIVIKLRSKLKKFH